MFQLNVAALWRRALVRGSRFRAVSASCLAIATVVATTAGGCAAQSGQAESCGSTITMLPGTRVVGGMGGSQAGFQPASGSQHLPARITQPAPPAGPAGPGGVAGLRTGVTAGQTPRVSTVTLVTGDKVTVSVTPGGAETVTPVLPPAAGRAATGTAGFARMSLAGDQFVVPYQAIPYLGSLLDPRLFDVSYLARLQAGHHSAARVRVTGRNGTPAVGKLADTPALGRLLASQWAAHRSGGPVAAGPLAGNARISLAIPAGGAAAPAAPLVSGAGAGLHVRGLAGHTLTLKFIGPDGKPATALGWVQNVDDARLSVAAVSPYLATVNGPPITGQPGPVRISVPDGTYSLQFAILTPHPGTAEGVDAALVVKPQVRISSSETITLDARAAVPYHATLSGVTAPQLRGDEMDVTRISKGGGGCIAGGFTLGLLSVAGDGYTASTLSATPVSTVTEGTLGFNAMSQLGTGGSQGSPSQDPNYYLVFPSKNSIPSSLAYTVPQSQLTAVHEHIYSVCAPSDFTSASSTGLLLWPTVYEPSWGDQFDGNVSDDPAGNDNASYVSPGERTDYWYSGDPKLTYWANTYFTRSNDPACNWTVSNSLQEQPQRIAAGQQISQDWGKAPAVPESAAYSVASVDTSMGLAGQLGSLLDSVPPAVRQDNNGMIALAQGDSQPSHYGVTLGGGGGNHGPDSFFFYRNGTLVLSKPHDDIFSGPSEFLLDLPLLPQAAAYRLDSGNYLDPFSTDRTETDWTFHSAPGDSTGSPPAGEACAPDPSRPCSFLPLLFIGYNLPLSYSEQATAGQPFPVTFTVQHQQGEAPPQGVSATVSASFDGGQTWTTPQAATGTGGGQFTATIRLPALSATNGFASLRITARDNAGNSVTQTIISAFGLAS